MKISTSDGDVRQRLLASSESLIAKIRTIERGEQKQSKKSDQKKIGSENWIKFKTAAAMRMGRGGTKKKIGGGGITARQTKQNSETKKLKLGDFLGVSGVGCVRSGVNHSAVIYSIEVCEWFSFFPEKREVKKRP